MWALRCCSGDRVPILEDITAFRDGFRKYREVCDALCDRDLDDERRRKQLRAEEKALRQKLTEDLGALERVLMRLPGVFMSFTAPNGQRVDILNSALMEDWDWTPKAEALPMADQILTKAVGAAKALGPEGLEALRRGRKKLFLAYAFRPHLDKIVTWLRQTAESLGYEVVEGDDPQPTSVSEKVKGKIASASVTVALMSKDAEKDGKGLASQWVVEEAVHAHALKKHVIRLIENAVDPQGRLFGDQEHIPIDIANPAQAIVLFTRMLGGITKVEADPPISPSRERELQEAAARRELEVREMLTRDNQIKLADLEARKKVIELELAEFPMNKADERRELDADTNRRRDEAEAAHIASGDIRQDGLHNARTKILNERNEQNRKNCDRWDREEKLRKIELEKLEKQMGELKSAIDAAVRRAAPAPQPQA